MRGLILATVLPVLAGPIAAQTGVSEKQLALLGASGGLRVAGYDIDFDEVRLPEGGGVILSDATLTRSGRDGQVLIGQIEMADTVLLTHILAPAAKCDPTAAVSGTVVARDVRFRPDADLGVSGGQEEIRTPLITLETVRIGCSWRMTGLADRIAISGVDGSRIDIMTLEGRLRLSGRDLRDLDARLDLIGMDLTGVSGPGGLQADAIGVSVTADLSDGAFIDLVRSDAPLADLLIAAAGSVTRGAIYMRGLELDPEVFLPERELGRLGLEGHDPISGDAEFAMSLERGEIRFRGLSDLSGMIRGEIGLEGSLPESGGFALPGAIAGSIPVPTEVLGITLAKVSIRYEDLGAARIIETLTGRSMEILVEDLVGSRVSRVSARLPGGLPSTVRAGWEAVLGILRSGRGAAGLRPDKPFSLLELAVSGVMGPSVAASRTGAWHEKEAP